MKDIEGDFFGKWSDVIKDISWETREPMWDQAIKYLVSEGAMEPTVYLALTQGQIQNIMLESDDNIDIHNLFVDFGKWLISSWGEVRFYVMRFKDGAELWLAYLMAVNYIMEWDGAKWMEVTA